MQTLRSAMSFIGREALRIVLPSWCIACHGELPWRDRVGSCCRSCWESLPRIRGGKCRSCALPWSGDASGDFLCIACSDDPLPVEWCDAWGEYAGALERVLHGFKFEHHDFLDAPLAALLHDTLRERGDLEFDAIVSVPMHRAKQKQRGYNQAELLGRALARLTAIPYVEGLARGSDSRTQSRLSRAERRVNVRGAFAAGAVLPAGSVLLVDDICTTGETLRACARVLLGGGAARVCAVTVAKAT